MKAKLVMILVIAMAVAVIFIGLQFFMKPSNKTWVVRIYVNSTDPFVVKGIYDPETLEINVGDTVVWVNEDTRPHSVEFEKRITDPKWIRTGDRWSYTFTSPGVYNYRCMPCFCNPMTGRVIVR